MKQGQKPIHIQRWAPADYHNDEHVRLLKARRDYLTLTFYRHFLDASYTSGGDLPADPEALSAIVEMRKRDVETALRFCVGRLLFPDGDRLYQSRVRRDVQSELKFREEQRGRGAVSASKRWDSTTIPGTRAQRLSAARAIGRHTDEEWEALLDVCGRVCLKCGAAEADLYGQQLTKDHILPISIGGSDAISNLQPKCRNCNTRSHKDQVDLRPTWWAERLTKRLTERINEDTERLTGMPNPPSPSPAPTPITDPSPNLSPDGERDEQADQGASADEEAPRAVGTNPRALGTNLRATRASQVEQLVRIWLRLASVANGQMQDQPPLDARDRIKATLRAGTPFWQVAASISEQVRDSLLAVGRLNTAAKWPPDGWLEDTEPEVPPPRDGAAEG